MKPKIYRDDLLGDLGNTLLLRPVYRRPVSEAVTERTANGYYPEKPTVQPEPEPMQPEPEPTPKVEPITLFKPHSCPKEDWETDEKGDWVPMDTLVRCPECKAVWLMEGSGMRPLDFKEQHLILPVFLLLHRFAKKR